MVFFIRGGPRRARTEKNKCLCGPEWCAEANCRASLSSSRLGVWLWWCAPSNYRRALCFQGSFICYWGIFLFFSLPAPTSAHTTFSRRYFLPLGLPCRHISVGLRSVDLKSDNWILESNKVTAQQGWESVFWGDSRIYHNVSRSQRFQKWSSENAKIPRPSKNMQT